jgi:hypothetical protein
MAGKSLIGSLRVFLGIDSAELTTGAKSAENSIKEFVENSKKHLEHLIEAFAVKELVEGFLKIDEHLDMLGKSAQKIGIPVEELSKLEYAAKLADVPFEGLMSTLEKFNKGISEAAATGKGKVAEAFKAMGISVLDAGGHMKTTNAYLIEMANSFSKHADGANKGALGAALFGKTWAEILPLLNKGGAGIDAAGKQLDQFGGTANKFAVEAAEKLIDDLKRMWQAFYSVAQQVVITITPAITNLTGAIVDFLGKGGGAKQVADDISFGLFGLAKISVELFYSLESLATEIVHYFDMIAEKINTAKDTLAEYSKIAMVAVNPTGALYDLVNKISGSKLPSMSTMFTNGATAGAATLSGQLDGINDRLKAALAVVDKFGASLGKADIADRDHLGGGTGETTKPDYDPFGGGAAVKATKDYQKAIISLIDSLKIQNEEFNKSALQMKIDTELKKAGEHATGAEILKITQLVTEHERLRVAQQTQLQEAANALAQQAAAADFLKGKFQSWFDSAISGTFDLKNALADLAKSIAQMGFQNLLGSLFAPAGGTQGSAGGGFLSGLGKILGFATGGTIMPGGSGGVDSQLVAFRKSPDERVDITRPGQMLTSGGGNVNFYITAHNSDRAAISDLTRTVGQIVKDQRKTILSVVTHEKHKNPSFAR